MNNTRQKSLARQRQSRFAIEMGADGLFSLSGRVGGGCADLCAPPADEVMAREAADGFARDYPALSARTAMSPPQKQWIARYVGCGGIVGLVAPDILFSILALLSFVVFLAILLWRVVLVGQGVRARLVRQPTLPRVAEADLPIYTLLIALYDEVGTAAQLSRAIRGLDYPQHKLDVKLLIEACDRKTEAALRAQTWPEHTELLVLPDGHPRTKPRALNYGLMRAKGEFVVVYDAEDRPAPLQLREAAARFSEGDETLACLQAPLVGQGGKMGWLSGQWALEYAIQFGILLPALAKLELPIALGGTSNHFRRAALEVSGGWDAWNVTEDADLGLRFARQGRRIGMLTSPTYEAPPHRLRIWVPQRSRWLKGFLQSWLVIMRQPAQAAKEMGVGGFVSMQLTLGAALLSAIAHGPWALLCVFCLLHPAFSIGAFAMNVLIITYAVGIGTGLLAPGWSFPRRLWLALTLPFYWPLQSVAMIRALYGLCVCPHFWAKTPHTALTLDKPPPCLIGPSHLPGLASALSSSSLPIGVQANPVTISRKFESHGSRS